ncbi:hypothetical protein HDV03_002638 [Kappamyces sp. JEL0829]|nr:hypothetical protein HDV03_002638 [Kappamyces sp. JEL0829]
MRKAAGQYGAGVQIIVPSQLEPKRTILRPQTVRAAEIPQPAIVEFTAAEADRHIVTDQAKVGPNKKRAVLQDRQEHLDVQSAATPGRLPVGNDGYLAAAPSKALKSCIKPTGIKTAASKSVAFSPSAKGSGAILYSRSSKRLEIRLDAHQAVEVAEVGAENFDNLNLADILESRSSAELDGKENAKSGMASAKARTPARASLFGPPQRVARKTPVRHAI